MKLSAPVAGATYTPCEPGTPARRSAPPPFAPTAREVVLLKCVHSGEGRGQEVVVGWLIRKWVPEAETVWPWMEGLVERAIREISFGGEGDWRESRELRGKVRVVRAVETREKNRVEVRILVV